MENNSQREHIRNRSALCCEILDINDLWGDKPGCAAPGINVFLLITKSSQPKIQNTNFRIDPTGPKHNILGFDIPMDHILLGHLRHPIEQPLHNILNLLQSELMCFDDAEQLAALEQVKHQID